MAATDILLSCVCYLGYAWCASCFFAKILGKGALQEPKKQTSAKIIFAILLFCINWAMAWFMENHKVPYIFYAVANHILLVVLTMAVFRGDPLQKETEKKFLAVILLALITGLAGNFSESFFCCAGLCIHSLVNSAAYAVGVLFTGFCNNTGNCPPTEVIGIWGSRIITLFTYSTGIIAIRLLYKPLVSVCSDKRKTWYLYLSVPLLCILFVMDFVNWGASNGIMVQNWENYGLYENQLFSHGAMCIFTGLAMAASGFFVFGMDKIYREERAGEEYHSQVLYYQMLEEQYTRQERLRHDLKNHLISLENLVQNRQWEQAGNYLREMAGAGQIEAGEEATGSLVMDALLYHKKREALENEIDWKCDIAFPNDSPIKEIDLCILVGNILDNALESCIRLQEKEKEKQSKAEVLPLSEKNNKKPWIQIGMRTFKQCLLFEVRNATDLTSPSETVKSQKTYPGHHGLGLANIKAVTDAYNGTMHMEIKEGSFILSVLLPLYQTQHCS